MGFMEMNGARIMNVADPTEQALSAKGCLKPSDITTNEEAGLRLWRDLYLRSPQLLTGLLLGQSQAQYAWMKP